LFGAGYKKRRETSQQQCREYKRPFVIPYKINVLQLRAVVLVQSEGSQQQQDKKYPRYDFNSDPACFHAAKLNKLGIMCL